MSFIDLYRELHADKIQQEFPPSSRVLIDTLIGEFNSARWIDSLVFSERDLVRLTGLKKTTLHEAKHFLTSRDYIKCTPFKKKARYSLGDKLKEWLNRPIGDHQPTSNRPVGDQLPTTFENPNIRVRDKTEDFKTQDLQSINPPRACAPVNWDCENELATLWLDNGGARVTAELLSYLQALTEKHGVEWTAQAIREAAGAFSGDFAMSLNFLRGCVKRKLEGGDKRAKTRVNRSNVLTFAGTTSSGKGRFDDAPPDIDWFATSGKGRFDDDPDYN